MYMTKSRLGQLSTSATKDAHCTNHTQIPYGDLVTIITFHTYFTLNPEFWVLRFFLADTLTVCTVCTEPF